MDSPTTVTMLTMETRKSPNPKRKKKGKWVYCYQMLVLQQDRTHASGLKTRKAQNKPLTWRKKEIKSKYHNNKIFALNNLDDLVEIKEYTEKI